VVSPARRRLEDGVPDPLGFVLETLGRHAANHRALLDASATVGQSLARSDRVEARRVAPAHRAVQLLDDVAALAEVSQVLLPVRGELPAARRHPLGDAQTLEVLEPIEEVPCLPLVARSPAHRLAIDLVVGRAAVELTVERGQPLLNDLLLARALDLRFEPRSQKLVRELLSGLAHAVGDVLAGHKHTAAFQVDTADDDVRVRVLGVPVVGRRPLEAPSELPVDPLHQLPDVLLEVEGIAVLGRHHEPELM
jgi:hypothetical protein